MSDTIRISGLLADEIEEYRRLLIAEQQDIINLMMSCHVEKSTDVELSIISTCKDHISFFESMSQKDLLLRELGLANAGMRQKLRKEKQFSVGESANVPRDYRRGIFFVQCENNGCSAYGKGCLNEVR